MLPLMKQKNNPANKLVLVGEDDIDDEEILEDVCQTIDTSINLKFLNNGQKLIEYLDKIKDNELPCLIILDYNMPGLNGAEILKKLQVNRRIKNIPKIIWSTSNAAAYKKNCLESGATDYMVKPYKIKELEAMLREMLSHCH